MTVRLDGCRPAPLGRYLQSLGVWSALHRIGLTNVRAWWSGDRLLLEGVEDLDEMLDRLRADFIPLPIVSPWNAGSGFAGNGKSASAERLLDQIRESEMPQLADARSAVAAGDRAVAEGLRRGWGGKGTDLWDKARKPEVVQLCRNLVADSAVPWIDATVVLGDQVTFSRLLGTGGNFGRQDLSVSYLEHALAVVDGSTRSQAWLAAALTGQESTPYLRGTVGQFDPGRAGGIQTSSAEKSDDKGFINPWSGVLTIEGAMLFTPSVGRRAGSETARVAVPFQVRGSTSGFASAAVDEEVTAEVWTPTWSRPTSLDEVRQLMRDGRAEWGGRPATSGVDFALAVRSLGIDRGVDRFTRHVVVNRLGQSPLAVAVGEVKVPDDDATSGLRPIDGWLQRLRWANHLPRATVSALRAADECLLAASRDDALATRLELLRSIGRLHRQVERSETSRAVVSPLLLTDPGGWLHGLAEDDVELRLAVAWASARDPGLAGRAGIIRPSLSPVVLNERGVLTWTGRPTPVDRDAHFLTALAEVHARRAMDAAREPANTEWAPAIKGICTGPTNGWWAHPGDLAALCAGLADLRALRDLLDALMLFDWRHTTPRRLARHDHGLPVPVSLALLMPFASQDGLPLAVSPETGDVQNVIVRSSPGWPALLAAHRVADVVADACARLRAAGVRGVPSRRSLGTPNDDGRALSAALLANVNPHHRTTALARVASVPQNPDSST